jgi:hypothetical protein
VTKEHIIGFIVLVLVIVGALFIDSYVGVTKIF